MRTFSFSLVGAVALVVVAIVAMGMGSGLVAAQENATANDSENATADLEPEFEVEFGDHLRILEYELTDGEATITFEADRSRTVTITDAMDGIGQDGIVEPYSREYDLERGETTITMDVTQMRGASTVGVSVGGQTARLSTQFQADEPDDPLQYFGGLSGLFTGIFMTTGIASASALYVVKREDSGVIKA